MASRSGRVGAMVDDRDADRELAVDRGGGRRGDAGFVQIGDDLGVDRVGVDPVAAIAGSRRCSASPAPAFRAAARRHAGFEMSRKPRRSRAIIAPSLLGAIGLQREPGLQRAKAARQIGAEIARPGRAGGEAAGLAAQIGGGRREGRAMLLAVAHHQEAGVVLHLAPFVEIERDRIRLAPVPRATGRPAATACRARRRRRRCETTVPRRGTARRAPRDRRSRRCRPCRPSRSPGTVRSPAARSSAIAPAQRRDVDAMRAVGRDPAQRVAAEAGEIHRLGDAAMRRRPRCRR